MCASQIRAMRLRCGLSVLTLITALLFSLSDGLAQGGGASDDSMPALMNKANAGDTHAQSELAKDYLTGAGVPMDWSLAAKWVKAAALQGDVSAMLGLSAMYGGGGPGLPANPLEAAKWLKAAALQGDRGAMFGLGRMYLDGGLGFPANPSEAAKWFGMAAEQGDAASEVYLADMYANGKGVPQDPGKAAMLYEKSSGLVIDSTGLTSRDLAFRFHRHLSIPEKQHILDGDFAIVTSTQGLPEPVKNAIAIITGVRPFAMADPDKDYQATDVIEDPELPSMRLIFAGVCKNRWFIHYEHGGIGVSHAVLVLEAAPDNSIHFLWGGIGFKASDLEDLRTAIASGRFTDGYGFFW